MDQPTLADLDCFFYWVIKGVLLMHRPPHAMCARAAFVLAVAFVVGAGADAQLPAAGRLRVEGLLEPVAIISEVCHDHTNFYCKVVCACCLWSPRSYGCAWYPHAQAKPHFSFDHAPIPEGQYGECGFHDCLQLLMA